MRCMLCLACLLALMLAGCAGERLVSPLDLIPTEVPEGTKFVPLDHVPEFQVQATLRFLRDPKNSSQGIAAVKIVIDYLGREVRRNVQAAAWLPEEMGRFTPFTVFGTNVEEWQHDLTPETPGFGIGTHFVFPHFEDHETIIQAMAGSTRLKIMWDEGSSVYVEFPVSHWQVEVEN